MNIAKFLRTLFLLNTSVGCFCFMAMHKSRNTGTGNGMWVTGNGEMLYFGECPQTFLGMSPNIPGNVLKRSGECR